MTFSLEEFCQSYPDEPQPWSHLSKSSIDFLKKLGLSAIHPFCQQRTDPFPSDIPPMGPLLVDEHHGTIFDKIVTVIIQVVPALYAMGELWLRLFASAIAPIAIVYLVMDHAASLSTTTTTNQSNKTKSNGSSSRYNRWIAISCVLSIASSTVVMTDEFYVLQFGPQYGGILLCLATFLSLKACQRYQLRRSAAINAVLLLLTVYLVFGNATMTPQFGGDDLPDTIEEGLYYNKKNTLVSDIVTHWPAITRTYSPQHGATSWLPTGDARTGIPFLVNFWHSPHYTRVWLPTHDDEVVALDICFPPTGHDRTKPIIFVLHGLNGGSKEEYVRDLTHRRSAEGYTVIVMIARGLMDLPIRGWNVFHGARIDDAHTAAKAVRRARAPKQPLIGVGYSMGAIIISNYVARSGKDCALDAAMAVSGGLDMRHMAYYKRALRLWQPLLVEELRGTFVIGKFGERYRHRLSKKQMLDLMRAVHVMDVDKQAVVTYNGYDDVIHYYSEMSAMGDIPMNSNDLENVGRVGNIAIPFAVLHALDDPLCTWRTVASKEGVMHPSNLVQTGSGNVMMLLTKGGGHVGWPSGFFPSSEKWRWMSDAVGGFVTGVEKAKARSKSK
mmetsp:Transcript_24107/g.33890  ORF Transcript_24107/g.33890 Transcript_24107/m.33890 type:complete len:611 (-) Transcript_24107:40-1872(-)